MKKKLTAKIQQLNPTVPQYSGSFAKCVIIEPETKETLLKKGSVYAIFDIQGDASFDTELIGKVVNDVIHNSYYQSENISPIQSMEKAVLEARDKIIQLSANVISSDQQTIKFNIISTVLWGNVMYTVQYGEMAYYLMKGGMIKPVNMVSEGNFCASSLVVSDDDVAIISTKAFEKDLPPEKLLTSSVSESFLKPNQACLVMKLIIDSALSDEEIVDFGLEKAIAKNKSKETVNSLTTIVNEIFKKIGEIFSNLLKSKTVVKLPGVSLPKITNMSQSAKLKLEKWMLIPVAFLVIGVGVLVIVKGRKVEPQKPSTPIVQEVKQSSEATSSTNKPEEENTTVDSAKDLMYKVYRINPTAFYDLKITDDTAEPSDVVAFTDKVVVTDRISGKIYISDRVTPKFTADAKTFVGIKSAMNYDGKLAFLDNTGYKTFNILNSASTDENKITADVAFSYSNFLYAISGNTLTKYKSGDASGTQWGQNENFKNSKSMAIAYDVYILTSGNQLQSYSSGNKNSYEVKGLENGFSDAVKIIADVDFKNVYIADKGNKSIVVLDDKGNLRKQFKTEKDSTWNDIRSIAVSLDEKTLYVLSGSKVYTVDLLQNK